MTQDLENVEVYEEYGGAHVGRCIVIEINGEAEYKLMNIGDIAVVPEDEPEWVFDALVEEGYEYTHY